MLSHYDLKVFTVNKWIISFPVPLMNLKVVKLSLRVKVMPITVSVKLGQSFYWWYVTVWPFDDELTVLLESCSNQKTPNWSTWIGVGTQIMYSFRNVRIMCTDCILWVHKWFLSNCSCLIGFLTILSNYLVVGCLFLHVVSHEVIRIDICYLTSFDIY